MTSCYDITSIHLLYVLTMAIIEQSAPIYDDLKMKVVRMVKDVTRTRSNFFSKIFLRVYGHDFEK